MKEWFKAAGIRAIKTIAQTAIATIGTAAVLGDVNWVMVASAAALAGVLSLLWLFRVFTLVNTTP